MNLKLSAPYAPLVRRIEAEATVIGDQVLKIDHFLNHRIEPRFITEWSRTADAAHRSRKPASNAHRPRQLNRYTGHHG